MIFLEKNDRICPQVGGAIFVWPADSQDALREMLPPLLGEAISRRNGFWEYERLGNLEARVIGCFLPPKALKVPDTHHTESQG